MTARMTAKLAFQAILMDEAAGWVVQDGPVFLAGRSYHGEPCWHSNLDGAIVYDTREEAEAAGRRFGGHAGELARLVRERG